MVSTVLTARVYLIRHGETEENRRKIVQGQLDTTLNAVGREQGRLVGGVLRSVPFSAAFSSDLTRASKTAQMILAHHPNVRLEGQRELRERMLGKFQGKDLAYTRTQQADDSVETADCFVRRSVQWWNRTILPQARTLNPPGDTLHHILVVTHGGFISTLMRSLMGSRKMSCVENVVIGKCKNASVTIIEVDTAGKGKVVQFNDTLHLTRIAVEAVDENVDEL